MLLSQMGKLPVLVQIRPVAAQQQAQIAGLWQRCFLTSVIACFKKTLQFSDMLPIFYYCQSQSVARQENFQVARQLLAAAGQFWLSLGVSRVCWAMNQAVLDLQTAATEAVVTLLKTAYLVAGAGLSALVPVCCWGWCWEVGAGR